MNATELFEKLVESRIPTTVTTFWSAIVVYVQRPIRDHETKGVNAEFTTPIADEAFRWLAATAAELYPQSEFAKWWRGHND